MSVSSVEIILLYNKVIQMFMCLSAPLFLMCMLVYERARYKSVHVFMCEYARAHVCVCVCVCVCV